MNKVEVMISKKMEVFNNIPVIQSRKIEVTEDSPLNMRVEKSIGDKIEKSLARTGVFIGKYSASKYLGQPISDIKAEERRIDNIIADRQVKIDSFVNETVDSYKKMVIKNVTAK